MEPAERSDVWGVCHELAVEVYRVTAAWPPAEMYGLARQARRAAVAAALNAADDPPVTDPMRRRRRSRRAARALRYLGYVLMLACELGYLSGDARGRLDRLRRRSEELLSAIERF